MLGKKIFIVSALITSLIVGGQAIFAKPKKEAKFKVRIENVSSGAGLTTAGGSMYPFALSPGLFVVTNNKNDFFKKGKKANEALERQAEDGNPEVFAKNLLTKIGSINLGIFNLPVGAQKPAPILPGEAYEFTFKASPGMRLNLIAMYGQSNDLFYAPEAAIELFDKNGGELTGDITEKLLLWDAGTEINQAPGIGADQAPRQKSANTGAAESLAVGAVKDAFSYPQVKDVLKITISAQ